MDLVFGDVGVGGWVGGAQGGGDDSVSLTAADQLGTGRCQASSSLTRGRSIDRRPAVCSVSSGEYRAGSDDLSSGRTDTQDGQGDGGTPGHSLEQTRRLRHLFHLIVLPVPP